MTRTRRRRLDRHALLARLEAIVYQSNDDDERQFDDTSMAQTLLNMVDVDQESEYQLCRRVAQHFLGRVPEPEDFNR